jgi:hypothetical protein
MAMHKRWILALVLAVAAVAATVAAYAGTVHATAPAGFTSTTRSKATFAEISSHNQSFNPQFWNEVIQTRGATDLYVQDLVWQPGGNTGWRTHPGPTFVRVMEGSVTVFDSVGTTCTRHVYSADTADNSFIDPGGDHVLIIRNETGAVAKATAVQFVPHDPTGLNRREDRPDPGTCSFASP